MASLSTNASYHHLVSYVFGVTISGVWLQMDSQWQEALHFWSRR